MSAAKSIIGSTFAAGQADVIEKVKAACITGQNRDGTVTVKELTQVLSKLDHEREAKLAEVNAEVRLKNMLDMVLDE